MKHNDEYISVVITSVVTLLEYSDSGRGDIIDLEGKTGNIRQNRHFFHFLWFDICIIVKFIIIRTVIFW